MLIDDIIKTEFNLYLQRYNAWIDSNQEDEVAQMMACESERILRQFYRLKFNDEPTENFIGWSKFMSDLGREK